MAHGRGASSRHIGRGVCQVLRDRPLLVPARCGGPDAVLVSTRDDVADPTHAGMDGEDSISRRRRPAHHDPVLGRQGVSMQAIDIGMAPRYIQADGSYGTRFCAGG